MSVPLRVANRYAKSLIEIAGDKGQLDSVKADMQVVANACANSRDLVLMLNSPVIANERKLSILDKIFGGKVTEITSNLFKVLSSKNRDGALPAIADAFVVEYNKVNGILKAELTSASPLSETAKAGIIEKVKNSFNAKVVLLQENIDASLLGGFKLRIDDQLLDQSISSKLYKIRKELSEKI